MRNLTTIFNRKKNNILSIYFTPGYPELNDTVTIIKSLDKCGVDFIELGIPFSDPMADGVTIQKSSQQAIANGINTDIIFQQVAEARKTTDIPIVMMCYFNSIFKYGIEKYLQKCAEQNIEATIIPDLPLNEYIIRYEQLFNDYNHKLILLVCPQTNDKKLNEIALHAKGFIYMVSQQSTTGSEANIENNTDYFNRVKSIIKETPYMIGFGINNRNSFNKACKNANGAIIGSEFIKAISESKKNIENRVEDFVKSLIN